MPVFDSVRNDLRFAVRHFARKPLSVATIVLVLALGIGVHSAVFSLIQAVTMRPAPGVPRDAALVRVRGREQLTAGGEWLPRSVSYPEFLDLAARREVFGATAAWTTDNVIVEDGANIVDGAVHAQFVTGNFFTTLGVRPAMGASLPATVRADQSEPELVAVIGHTLWQSAFGAEPGLIGRTVRVNDVPVRVIGVAPPRFNGATPTDGDRTLWIPLSARAAIVRGSVGALVSRDTALLQMVARLSPGVPVQQADATARVVSTNATAQMSPRASRALEGAATSGIRDADVVPLRGDTELPASKVAALYATVFGSVALLILLIACTNVSALVVGAAVSRRHEIAIRLSLGASRTRLVRQLLTESMLLAVVGGTLGLTLYWWIVRIAAARLPQLDLTPDLGTVLFTMVFALGTGILFGLAPALHATKRGVAQALKDSGTGATSRSRLQRAFVIAQIVLTQPMLVGLALMLGTLMRDASTAMDTSTAEHVLMLRADLRNASGTPAQAKTDVLAAMERLRQSPGVVQMVAEPVGVRNSDLTVRAEDRSTRAASSTAHSVHIESTAPGYFAMINVPIIRGRDLVASDTTSQFIPVIIGSGLAQSLWGSGDPIGRRFEERTRAGVSKKELVVVGVFDARVPTTRGGDERVFTMLPGRTVDSWLVRTSVPARALVSPVRALMRAEMPRIPVQRLQTLADFMAENESAAYRVSAGAAAGGALTLLMAAIGLYGVVALALGQRRREIGIRMALGARPRQVVRMLFLGGVQLSVLGLLIGLPFSVFVLRILADMARLPDISMVGVSASIAGVVIAVASVATWIPARRAATVDPVVALRAE